MIKQFNFQDLFIFEMANNHQGDVEHGKRIIQTFGDIAKKYKIRAAMKFQFRELDSFIHPNFKNDASNKHIPRFMGTRLDEKNFLELAQEARNQGLLAMSTPFDEPSVDLFQRLNLDIIKIGSCSATDFPLLERVAEEKKPVIVSTAGLSLNQIDRVVSLFEYKGVDFAIMHCVAIYPTPSNQLKLNQIDYLKARYPQITVGFSTHEDPNNTFAIQVAYAKGARIFERHIGLATDVHKLNAYSSNADQISKWIEAYLETVAACGGIERSPGYPDEIASLKSLMRGIYVKNHIRTNEPIKRKDVFFAMPLQENQLHSGEWRDGLIADRDYKENEPLGFGAATSKVPQDVLIYQVLLQVKGMLNNARVSIGKDSSIEISHHYGMERFREFGAVLVNCINRTYCKKIVVLLPRQKHPSHFHKRKEETFQLLHGDLEVGVDGMVHKLKPGDTLLIHPNQWHKFHTLDGAIFEEVSTTDYENDSVYEDEQISRHPREKRKTKLPNWEAAENSILAPKIE